jgi:hypothetical protein
MTFMEQLIKGLLIAVAIYVVIMVAVHVADSGHIRCLANC